MLRPPPLPQHRQLPRQPRRWLCRYRHLAWCPRRHLRQRLLPWQFCLQHRRPHQWLPRHKRPRPRRKPLRPLRPLPNLVCWSNCWPTPWCCLPQVHWLRCWLGWVSTSRDNARKLPKWTARFWRAACSQTRFLVPAEGSVLTPMTVLRPARRWSIRQASSMQPTMLTR